MTPVRETHFGDLFNTGELLAGKKKETVLWIGLALVGSFPIALAVVMGIIY